MFSKLKWFNRGDPEATEDNSVLNAKNMNDLEQRIEDGFNTIDNHNAGSHNSIFRGKDITSYLDNGSLWEKISSGKFEDLYIGDYFLKNNVKYRIAGFDYYLHKGNPGLSIHHIAIVPDENISTGSMNSTVYTTDGYINSLMYTTTLPNILTTLQNIFGDEHIIKYTCMLSSSTNATGYNKFGEATGCSNNWVSRSRYLDLMCEAQVFGITVWSSSGFDTGNACSQFPLFALAPEFISNDSVYWLRDVVSNVRFAVANKQGNPYYYNSNIELGIRPFFFIGTSEE